MRLSYCPAGRQTVLTILFFLIVTLLLNYNSFAANDSIVDESDLIWPLVKQQLEKSPSDTSFQMILMLVRGKCGDDLECQYNTYTSLKYKLEQVFNLHAAIFIGDELIAISKELNDIEKEAYADLDQLRFYDAVGDYYMAVKYMDRALQLFLELDDQPKVTYIKTYKLIKSLEFCDLEDVLPELNNLLKQEIKKGYDLSSIYLFFDIIPLSIQAGKYKMADTLIRKLDVLINKFDGAFFEINTNLFKASLAKARGEIDSAENYFKKTLYYSKLRPDRWHEINALQSLATIDYEKGDYSQAKLYLDTAQYKAEKLNLHDLLTVIYKQKSLIAEQENDYKKAFQFLKDKYSQENTYDNRKGDFDLRRYYLRLENQKILNEKEKKALELKHSKTYLRYLLAILFLIFLLVTGLVIGVYKQRKGKRELKKQNDIISQQSEQLKNIDEMKSRFFANVSHELRTPLTLLRGPVDILLKENNTNSKQNKLLKIASQNGKQLELLINEILDLRKLDMGKMEIKNKPIDLKLFFNRYFSQFESLAHHKQIKFSFKINIEEGFIAEIDEEKFRQILYNLLSNAFKFTDTEGYIIATSTFQNNNLLLEVRDSGAGIHPIDLPNVFDRYYQSAKKDAPTAGGTGIGLALCKDYTNLMGGKISVESKPGEGSIFKVVVPLERSEKLPATFNEISNIVNVQSNNSDEQKPKDKNKADILVVEDNLELQEYMRVLLESEFNIITAENGQKALDIIPENKFQLIISDLMMPVMDGYQLLNELKNNDETRHIPVIMLTARADAKNKLKALQLGVDDYLMKPFDEEELYVRINNLLKRQEVRNDEKPAEINLSNDIILSSKDQKWMKSFEDYVRSNFSNYNLSVSSLAYEFAMSESTLLRQIKRLIGITPIQYIQEVRLEYARELLENHEFDSIKKIADEAGYADVRSFSRSFKNRYGKLPSSFLIK